MEIVKRILFGLDVTWLFGVAKAVGVRVFLKETIPLVQNILIAMQLFNDDLGYTHTFGFRC